MAPFQVEDGRIVLRFGNLTQEKRDELLQPYEIETGRLVWTWNHLQDSLSRLFWRTTGVSNGALAYAIWHSTPSDLAQRKMLRAAAKVRYSAADDTAALEAIEWVLNKIDSSLVHNRNDAIHAPLIIEMTTEGNTRIKPHDMTNNPRAASLEGKEILTEIIRYRETADVLRRYCNALFTALRPPRTGPLPERPVLPHAQHTKTSKKTHKGKPRKGSRHQHLSVIEKP